MARRFALAALLTGFALAVALVVDRARLAEPQHRHAVPGHDHRLERDR